MIYLLREFTSEQYDIDDANFKDKKTFEVYQHGSKFQYVNINLTISRLQKKSTDSKNCKNTNSFI
jgi:hypothetical protein